MFSHQQLEGFARTRTIPPVLLNFFECMPSVVELRRIARMHVPGDATDEEKKNLRSKKLRLAADAFAIFENDVNSLPARAALNTMPKMKALITNVIAKTKLDSEFAREFFFNLPRIIDRYGLETDKQANGQNRISFVQLTNDVDLKRLTKPRLK